MDLSSEVTDGLAVCAKLPPPQFKALATNVFPCLLREKNESDLLGICIFFPYFYLMAL